MVLDEWKRLTALTSRHGGKVSSVCSAETEFFTFVCFSCIFQRQYINNTDKRKGELMRTQVEKSDLDSEGHVLLFGNLSERVKRLKPKEERVLQAGWWGGKKKNS